MRSWIIPSPLLTLSLGALLTLSACKESATPSGPTESEAPSTDVLVTVNGTPIRVADLHFVLSRDDRGRGRGADEEKAKRALEKIIDEELARQGAERLGLDRDPEYIRRHRFMEAPLKDFERYALSEAFTKQEILDKATPTEEEARAYFEKNRAHFATEYRLQQILIRGKDSKAEALKAALDGGKSFDEVAGALFPEGLEPGKQPWTLPFLPWSQIPEPWHEALESMQEGDVSEILHGPKQRSWIIKLLERRSSDSITFETARAEVVTYLQKTRMESLRQATLEKLRAGAKIVRHQAVEAMPPAPDPEE